MVGTSLIVVLLLGAIVSNPDTHLVAACENRILKWIGTRSYGLYLWHWPVLVIMAAAFPVAVGSLNYFVRSILAIALTIIICEISYVILETPVRKRGFRQVYPAWKIPGAVGAVLAVVAMIIAPAKTATQLQIEQAETAIAAQQASGSQPGDIQELPPQALPGEFIDPALDTSPLQPGDVTALGDSMVTSAYGGFTDRIPGITILAMSNRQWHQEPDILAGELATGQVSRAVFICLGTNAGVTDINLVHQVVQMLGPQRIVMLVTLYSPSTFVESSNAALGEVADQYANVGVIDWYSHVSAHPEWLQVDETHPSIEGSYEFAQFIYDELQRFTGELDHKKAEQTGTVQPSTTATN